MGAALRESTTLKFVLSSWLVLTGMWVSGQVTATLTEYATSVGIILATWLGREWKEAHYASKNK